MSSHDDSWLWRLATMALAVVSPLACGAQSTFGIQADGTAIVSDDPFLLNDGATSAAALQLEVRPRLSQTFGPATTADLSGQVAYRQYTRRYGDFLTGQVRAEARHRDSEYLSFDTALFYARALPSDALTETIDFSVEPQNLRQAYGTLTHVDVNTDARTSFNLSVGWDRLRYPGSQLLLPTDALTTSLNARRLIAPNSWVGILGGYTRSQVVNSAALIAKSVRGTFAFRPRPALDANVQLGVEWADLGAWPGLGTPPGSGRARPSGSANICYRPMRFEACLDTSLRGEVSAVGGLQREYFVGARGRYQIGEHSAVLANAEYRKVALGPVTPEASALRASVGYDRRLTRNIWWTSTGSYIDRRFISGHRADALVLQFGVSFRKERL